MTHHMNLADVDFVGVGEEITRGELDITFVGGPCHGDTGSDPGTLHDMPPTWEGPGPTRSVTGLYQRTRSTTRLHGKKHLIYGWTGVEY